MINLRFGGENLVALFNVPAMPPLGGDLSICYKGTLKLKEGLSAYQGCGYPPFFNLLLTPFVFAGIEYPHVYFIYKYVLALCFVGTIFLGLSINDRKLELKKLVLSVFVAFSLFHTYPVLFAFERANHDITAGFFSMLALFFIVRKNYGWAIAALVMAIQIKVYPLILVSIFFVRAGFRRTAILGAICFLCLFVLGIPGLREFYHNITGLQNAPYVWKGNMSLYSYITQAEIFNVLTKPYWIKVYRNFFIAGFALTWLVYYFWSSKGERVRAMGSGGFSPFSRLELGIIGMAYQLMCLLPGTSHDYKAPILIVPILLLIASPAEKGRYENLALLGGISLLAWNFGVIFQPINHSDQNFIATKVMANFFVFFCVSCIPLVHWARQNLQSLGNPFRLGDRPVFRKGR